MSGKVCLRCLSRPLVPAVDRSLVAVSQSASFSTSPSLSREVLKKKGAAPVRKKSQGGTASYKQGRQGGKNAPQRSGRPPAAGERKLLRKRVVLSNTNALEVHGLQDFTANNTLDAARQGQVLGFSNDVVDSLRALDAFKPTQGWSLFRRPATLVRKETVEMSQLVQSVQEGEEPTTIRNVVYGERGSGKSVLLLQAMATALLKGWVVVHIPEANELTIGHTSYLPSSDSPSDSPLYIQPHYTASLLGAIAKANYNVLSTLRLSRKHDLPIPIQENISLVRFAELGAKDPDISWPIYRALMAELTAPSQDGEGLSRPPLMFTLDAVNHVMRDSAYLSANVEKIHAHDLALVNHFMRLLSGADPLSNGGVILAADSSSNRPSTPTFDFALSRNQALAAGEDLPQWDAYAKLDRRSLETMEGVNVRRLKGLSKHEAKGIMEYYAKSGMLRHAVNDTLIGEKWTLSGGGIIGALEKASVTMRV